MNLNKEKKCVNELDNLEKNDIMYIEVYDDDRFKITYSTKNEILKDKKNENRDNL